MEDTSLYGKNREGKVALCETCAYDGFCRDKIRYYRCRNYIKIRDDYEPTKTNPTGDRNDGCGSSSGGGGCLCRSGITSVIPQRSTQRLVQMW